MPTLSEFDRKQEELDWRVENLRRQIPPKDDEPKDAKPLSAGKRLELEHNLEGWRRPQREPERSSPFAAKSTESSPLAEPGPMLKQERKKSVAVATQTEEVPLED